MQNVNKKPRVLILGGTGMLGHKLVQRLSSELDVWCTIRGSFDTVSDYGIFTSKTTIEKINVENESDLHQAIEAASPEFVINAAGIIKQLPTSKDVITTLSVNSILPHRLKPLAINYDFQLICISTDCVFQGDKGSYREEDPADALDLYGRSKNIGEVTGENCLTIRTSIIGRELRSSHSLVEWFLSNRGKQVNGFVNAIYSGFPTVVFADIILELIRRKEPLNGLYHVSSDPINKFDLLELVNREYRAGVEIKRSEDFKIDRSLDSLRFREETGFAPPPWPEMIRRMAADTTPYDLWRK
jgi:dTDP-4-dehydrorhamnose reductase